MTSKLDHFADLVSKATPGPWWYTRCYGVATIESKADSGIAQAVEYLKTTDAEFIASSRQMSEKLIAVARAAKALLTNYGGEARDCDIEALDEALHALEASE